MNNYVPGFSNYLQRFAEGGQALPTEQPVAAQAAPAYPDMPADYAQRAAENARRAYDLAAQKSFGARGELSKGLDRIDTSSDFDYSPTAAQYLYDVGRYPTENTEYELSPMNLMKVDPQTGAPMPYTSGQLEQYAQQPLADQFYANFAYGGPGSDWDVGALQFAPNQQYRLIDRSTGDVVYSGTGYEAGKNISQMAKGMFDKSGQQANWLVQEAAPGSDQWTQRYEHVPDVNGFTTWLKMVAPMLGGALAAPLGLAGNLGAAAGSAIGSAGAGVAAGDSIGDILKNAALSGASSYAAGQLFNKLGGGKVPSGGGLSADDLVSMGVSPTSATGLASSINSVMPGNIVVVGSPKPSIGLPGVSGGALSAAAPTITQGPEPRRPDYGDKADNQQYPEDIVVTAAPKPTATGLPVPNFGSFAPSLTTPVSAPPATQAEPQKQSTISKIADYMQLAGLGIGALGSLFGGGQQTAAKIANASGLGGLNPTFSAKLPGANIPGLPGGTGSGAPRPAATLAQQGMASPQDYYRYGYGPEQSFFDYVPMGAPNTSKAYTGYAKGGFAVEGPGDGREDKIPAMLSDGEYVIDAETVALLGNGSNKAGADMLDQFRVKVRKHKGRELARGKFSKNAKRPEQYLGGGRA